MAAKANKKKTISKEDLLYQPLALAVNGYGATAFQQNTVIAILRKLRGAIKEMQDNQFKPKPRQLTLFETHDVLEKNYLKEGDIVFDLHMRELGVPPKHYQDAFNTVCKTGSIMVWVPMKMDGKEVMMLDNLFNVVSDNVKEVRDPQTNAILRYEYVNRSPSCTIIIPHAVAAHLFPPDKRIYDFLEPTAMLMSEKSPKRLYMYLSNFKNMPEGYTVGYWRFRHDIGMNDEDAPIDPETKERKILYPYYSYFYKRVIKPAYEQMKKLCEEGLCDFWFEIDTIYDRPGRQKNPDKLHFTFHFSEMGQALKSGKTAIKLDMDIEMLLLNDLAQTRGQVKALIARLTDQTRATFYNKVTQLVQESRKPREVPISNLRAWANRSLTLLLDELEQLGDVEEAEVTEIKQYAPEFLFEEPKQPQQPQPEENSPYSDQELSLWNDAMRELNELIDPEEYRVFWSYIHYGGIHENCLCILVPNRYVCEHVMENDKEQLEKALMKVYGSSITGFKWALQESNPSVI